jgi:integrase
MLINQDFAHFDHKSPAKRKLTLIGTTLPNAKEVILTVEFERATKLLKGTLIRIDGAYAPSTIRAYKTNFERFINYCETVSSPALPADPETVAKYIKTLTKSGLKSASIRLAVASISTIHKLNELHDPTQLAAAKLELRRMHRSLGRASKQAFGITEPILQKMLVATTSNLQGLRDKALILTAYDSLCRRSEITSLRLKDIQYDENDSPIKIKIRKSKTDQEGIGRLINLDSLTQKAIKTWINQAKIENGFLFRGVKNNGEVLESLGPGQINRIYKRLATAANLTKEQISNISGHSIRIGAAQDLVNAGVSLPTLMLRGRWTKPDTALRYTEMANIQEPIA